MTSVDTKLRLRPMDASQDARADVGEYSPLTAFAPTVAESEVDLIGMRAVTTRVLRLEDPPLRAVKLGRNLQSHKWGTQENCGNHQTC